MRSTGWVGSMLGSIGRGPGDRARADKPVFRLAYRSAVRFEEGVLVVSA